MWCVQCGICCLLPVSSVGPQCYLTTGTENSPGAGGLDKPKDPFTALIFPMIMFHMVVQLHV